MVLQDQEEGKAGVKEAGSGDGMVEISVKERATEGEREMGLGDIDHNWPVQIFEAEHKGVSRGSND